MGHSVEPGVACSRSRSASRFWTGLSNDRRDRCWRSAAKRRRSAIPPANIRTPSRRFSKRSRVKGSMHALDRLFDPRSIAVVGASADASKLTGRPVSYLQRHGFSGADLSHQSARRIDCRADVLPDVSSLPSPPDVGIVLLGADRVIDAVRDLSKAGAGAAIVLASGFAEAGGEGQRRQQRHHRRRGSDAAARSQHHRSRQHHRQDRTCRRAMRCKSTN